MRPEQGPIPPGAARRKLARAVARKVGEHLNNRFEEISSEDIGNYETAIEGLVVAQIDDLLEEMAQEELLALRGIEPNEANIAQLEVLLRALRIYDERNKRYRDQWKESGWMGALYDVRKKAARLFRQFWGEGTAQKDAGDGAGEAWLTQNDDAYDLINFAAFFLRGREEGNEWGTWL